MLSRYLEDEVRSLYQRIGGTALSFRKIFDAETRFYPHLYNVFS
ncbi:MAG: hypothetical protein V7K89_19335 [Nostoc sp.]